MANSTDGGNCCGALYFGEAACWRSKQRRNTQLGTAVGGERQLSGNAADWGTGECTAAEISVAQILQEDQLGGELANCWLLAGGEIQLSGSSPDWGVYCSRVYRSRTSAVGKSLLGKALLEEASCRRTSYYYFAIPHHLNSAAGCHVSLLLFLSDKCYHM